WCLGYFRAIFPFLLPDPYYHRLSRSTRQTIRAVVRSGDMNKSEVEGKNCDDPTIDACARGDVGIRKHAFDITGINFDDKVAYANEIEPKCTEGTIETIYFQLGLRKAGFAIVERD